MTVENREELLDKTAKKMAEIGLGDDDVDYEDEEEVKEEEKGEEKESSTDEDTATDENTTTSDESDETDEDSQKDKGDEEAEEETPTLPDALRRSAIHQSWTQEDIDKFMKADPELAIQTFEKIHVSSNRLTEEFSKLGQAALNAQNQPTTITQPQRDEESVSAIVEGLKEDFGDEPIFEAVVKPLAKALDAQKQRPQPQPEPAPVQQTQTDGRDSLVQQVTDFFGHDSLRDYDGFYGTPGHVKTSEQINSYNQVLRMADAIIAGTTLQGNPLSAADAMERAHLMISEPFRETATAEALKTSVKRRSSGIQLKPSSSPASSDTNESDKNVNGKPSRGALLKKTKERLTALNL